MYDILDRGLENFVSLFKPHNQIIMKKHRVITIVTIILVCIIGSVPGLWTILLDVEGPFQRPDGPYWKALVIGVPSILSAIFIGYLISKYLLSKWYKENKSIVVQSIIIFSITIIAGLIAVMVGWEINWIVEKAFGWGGSARLEWLDFLTGIPLMFIYCIIPVGITSLIYGLFSMIYLIFSR